MDYQVLLYLNRLPNVLTENRIIDGKEQTCVILPVEDNQFRRGRMGNWCLPLRLHEIPPNAEGKSHTISLVWRTVELFGKAKEDRNLLKCFRLGSVLPFIQEDVKPVNRPKGQDLFLKGTIVLNDIPKKLIFRNKLNDMRFIAKLRMKSLANDEFIWTGYLCVDLIPKHLILERADSGKKYINVVFKPIEIVDANMNTHILVVETPNGSEIEIGRFREFHKNGEVVRNEMSPEDIHDTPVNMRTPDSIDGLRF